ncbi:hypothetical protein C8Q80DRAFT_46235 [Daedaleopsis nitida]|nr:hypothetical protein C8Q80DRAFT_46235 [Daedaleopsis nitida]
MLPTLETRDAQDGGPQDARGRLAIPGHPVRAPVNPLLCSRKPTPVMMSSAGHAHAPVDTF